MSLVSPKEGSILTGKGLTILVRWVVFLPLLCLLTGSILLYSHSPYANPSDSCDVPCSRTSLLCVCVCVCIPTETNVSLGGVSRGCTSWYWFYKTPSQHSTSPTYEAWGMHSTLWGVARPRASSCPIPPTASQPHRGRSRPPRSRLYLLQRRQNLAWRNFPS